LLQAARVLKAARPTAINLAWGVDRMLKRARAVSFWRLSSHRRKPVSSRLDSGFRRNDERLRERKGARGAKPPSLYSVLLEEARRIEREDLATNKAIGATGAKLLKKKSVVLTHCNAGALATAGYGTALSVIREAHRQGKIKKVFVDETRPYMQGARLTTWELQQERIPHELITDNMAAHFMKKEKIGAVLVGCDRVTANGDTANKIGTYALAVLARYHRIPFYVAMPTSTLDLHLKRGEDIVIEERSPEEVVCVGRERIAPQGTRARHPAFDVTPARLITAFVTEKGIIRPPYLKNLKRLKSG
ncbi:MAG: S-methyl-5-thioribose-1-phosphate isomerase, partial [Elusimicrobia bacterium]|nr:S-methyl-5-thioribose-1-phosphate isomerase [Candidatus Obscuribacterium magneticum]